MLKLDLSGKRALVCGASQGIGAASAHALAECGATVLLSARRKTALQTVLDKLPCTLQQTHRLFPADLGNTQQAHDLAEFSHAHGPLHILVNNSGGPPAGPICDASGEAFEAAFRQQLLAAHRLAQAVIPAMSEARYGRIINIISTSVKIPIPNLGVSNTIRGAVANWSKTLATEVASLGITVNNVLPGFTNTPRLSSLIRGMADKTGRSESEITAAMRAQVPLGRFVEAQETAAAVAFLSSDLAACITGINLPVDGGRTGCL